MINRYEGNTGRFTRMPEPQDLPPPPPGPMPRPVRPAPEPMPPPPPGLDLRRLLPGIGAELETEDLLLLLILYLLYRESGDKDWLMTLGAMLFLP